MRTLCFFCTLLTLTLGIASCGGGGHSSPPPVQAVSVTISPSNVNLIAGASQQFTAVVHGASNTAVTWSMASSGCSGAGCGTITSSGMYTAPSPIPANVSVNVVATAAADSSKSGTAIANLIPVSVTISPASGSVFQRDMMQFTASVAGTPNTAVTWDIGGLIGGGCATGYVWPSGLYTTSYCDIYSPPQTFTLRATSNADSSKFGTAQVTVTGPSPNNAKMNGNYALLFQGYDNDGPVALAGHFIADGAGSIIGGELYLNSASNTIQMSASGNYSIGSDNRGTMYLGSWIFRFTVDSEGKIRIIDFDETLNNPIRGSGEIREQDTSAFSLNAFNGNFAIGLRGDLSGSGMAIVGQFNSNINGVVDGFVDTVSPSTHLGSLQLAGTLASPDPLSGLGYASLTILNPSSRPNAVNGTTYNLVYFVISDTEAFVVQRDTPSATVPVLGGVMRKQSSGSFTNASLNGSLVMQLSGPAAGGAHAILGRAVFDGVGGISNGLTDDNHAGTVSAVGGEHFTGNYTVGSGGRGTADISLSSGGATSFTFYLVDAGEGFVVGGTPSSHVGEAVFGSMEPQIGAPFTKSSVAGSYAAGTLAPATNSVPSASAAATLNSTGNFSGMLDTCTAVGCALSQGLSGTITITDAMAGRGTITAGALSGASAFYIVSPTKVWMLNSLVTGDTTASIISVEQ
jgi:hypothetical protein